MKNQFLISIILFFSIQGFLGTSYASLECIEILSSTSVSQASEDVKNLKLRTERLEIRAIRDQSDVDSLVEIFMLPKVQEMSGDYVDKYTITSIISTGHKTLEQAKKSGGPFINFAVVFDGKIVGMTQVANGQEESVFHSGIAQLGQSWGSISYHLHPDFWGKGIASELSQRVVQFAFDNLEFDGIHGQAIKSNAGSARVLERTGLEMFEFADPIYDHFQMTRSSYLGQTEMAEAVGE